MTTAFFELDQAVSLVDVLKLRAERTPDKKAYIFLRGDEEEAITFAELDRRARVIAGYLQEMGRQGDRVILFYPPGLEYIAAFLGCLYAGMVAVPLYPPRPNQKQYRAGRVVEDCGARIALTRIDTLPAVATFIDSEDAFAEIRVNATDSLTGDHAELWTSTNIAGDDLAFLQYTSGSTGDPKGVMVSHANLMANEAAIASAFGTSADDLVLSWLPMYHDMGLIGTVLHCLYQGCTSILMPSVAFIQDPSSWLEAISKYRATVCGGPNFAYELCLQKMTAARLDALDLSCWRIAFSGAEPVRAATLHRFSETFKRAGFSSSAYYPCYGMAEATLFISGGQPGSGATFYRVDKTSLEKSIVQAADPEDQSAAELVGCGFAHEHHQVMVVNPTTYEVLPDGHVGEIWFRGPSKAGGYWNKPELTSELFQAYAQDVDGPPFLRTQDLGFIHQGHVYVTGRLKDLIIIRGRNHYAQDIEWTMARCHPGMRPECGAAFSVEVDGEERLVVVQEVERTFLRKMDMPAAVEAVREAIALKHEVQAYAVVLVKPGRVPKTSSGKVQRFAARQQFLSGDLQAVQRDVLSEPDEVAGAAQLNRETVLAAPEPEQGDLIQRYFLHQVAANFKVNAARIDRTASLNRYGMDSMMAIALQHRINEDLEIDLPLVNVLRGDTIQQLAAAALDQIHGTRERQPAAGPHIPHAYESEFPQSSNQRALWFLYQLAPESTAYNISFAMKILGPISVSELRGDFRALVARHPALRTTFFTRDGVPYQKISDDLDVDFQAVNAGDWDTKRVQKFLDGQASQPFDLQRGPLLRLRLLTLSDTEHVFLLTVHHIISDFWSLLVMMDELGSFYATSSERGRLKPLTRGYARHVREQKTLLASNEGDRLWQYWRNNLGENLPPLNLPTDRPRPNVQTYNGASHWIEMSSALTAGVKKLGFENQATLYVTMLAAYQMMLHHFSGQEDFAVGSTTAGRHGKDMEGIIGYYVNPIVLRTRPKGRMTFLDFLEQTRTTVLGALEHAEFPFQLLVERLQPERDAGRSPLFQVLFSLQNPHRLHDSGPFALRQAGARMKLGELTIESMTVEQGVSQFDLALFVAETDRGMAALFEYNTDLFDPFTIERMAEHYHRVLEAVVQDPNQSLTDLATPNEAERHHILNVWNDTSADYPIDVVLHELIRQQSYETPDAYALRFDGDTVNLSYRELDQHTNRLARYLREAGVGPETLVGVCMERSKELVFALLSVMKAGGAYVPMDPDYPAERVKYMVDDSAAKVLITLRKHLPTLPQTDALIIALDDEAVAAAVEAQKTTPFDAGVTPQSAAYMIYTSGSTGRPKGVINSHAGICNRLFWMQDAYQLDGTDHVLQKTPFSFDVSVWEFFWPLMTGAKLVVAKPGGHQDPHYLAETIENHEITTMHFVPSMLRAFVEADFSYALPGLRRVFASGEALPLDLSRAFLNRFGADLHNLYGPTEAAVDVTFWKCRRDDDDTTVPIGKPIANTQIYILDKDLATVRPRVPGELFIGGVNLARGYHGRGDLTAEKFIPNPYGQPGSRLYRTGDLARFRADGNIEFLGRIDHQVKLRGFRIELGEIEAAITAFAGVAEAVCMVRDDDNIPRLVAYIRLDNGGLEFDNRPLRNALSEHLPEYMVPGFYVVMEQFPLSPNGKCDRKALPAPEKLESLSEYTAPRNETETALAQIWCEVLKLEKVGVHNNFFELGGDSIIGLQVVSRAKGVGILLKPQHLFQGQTIAELAQLVTLGAKPSHKDRGPVKGESKLLPIQQRFFDMDLPKRDHYNQSVTIQVESGFQPEFAAQAMRALTHHHDALRLRFTDEGEQIRAEHAEINGAPPFEVRDLSWVTPGEQEKMVDEACVEIQRRMDIEYGPLLRVVYLRMGDKKPGILILAAHHLVIDGVSWRILLEDFSTAYNQLRRQTAVSLPPRTTAFRDWAEALHNHRADGGFDIHQAYWNQLAERDFADLPVDHQNGPNTVASTDTIKVTLDAAKTRDLLKEASKAYNTQIEDLLLTALSLTLARWSGRTETLIEMEGHGREDIFDDVDLSRTIGWCTSLYPVGLDIEPDAGPGANLKSIKEQRRAVPGRGLSYGLFRYGKNALDNLKQIRSGVLFNYLGQLESMVLQSPLLRTTDIAGGQPFHPRTVREHLFEINAFVLKDQLNLEWVFSTNFHSAETTRRLAEIFIEELEELIHHCLSPEAGGYTPSDFPLAGFNQSGLDQFVEDETGIEDIYPLSPMQEGMLFHTLYQPQSSAYFQTLHFQIEGDLSAKAFRSAWELLLNRHDALRAAFHWEGLAKPLQKIGRITRLPWREEDWRAHGKTQQDHLDRYLEERRGEGFQLNRAPLMHFGLFRLTDTSWRFVFHHHHLLLDGWSLANILGEVMENYRALKRGRQPKLGAVRPYRDYIAWLMDRQTDGQPFWEADLAGFITPTPLPGGIGSGGREAFHNAEISLTPALNERLRRFAKEHHLTLNTVIQGAWALLLSRYSGERDVLFGATVAGRPTELNGVEQMTGLFINTLPVRTAVHAEAELKFWLKDMQQRQAERDGYAYSPLADIRKWSEVDAGANLFDTIVVFENYPLDGIAARGEVSISDIQSQEHPNFPITLVAEPGATLKLRLTHDRARVPQVAADAVLKHLHHLIESMINAPGAQLRRLSMLDPEEHHHLTRTRNQPSPAWDTPLCLHKLFEKAVAKFPNRIAAVMGDDDQQAVSYVELNHRADKLAAYLQHLGVGPETLVGLCVHRDMNTVVSILGILKAGGAYVPMDPIYPTDRLNFIVEDSAAPVVITHSDLAERFKAESTHLLCLDQAWDQIEAHEGSIQDHADPQNTAYIIYTSGSTGKPKGVPVSHANVARIWDATEHWFGFNENDVWTLFHSYAFDFSVWELWGALLYGGRLVVVPHHIGRSPADYLQLLSREGVTVLNQTPSNFYRVIAEDGATAQPLPLALRYVIFGGEALDPYRLGPWFKRHGDKKPLLVNMYGITETTIHVTWRAVTAEDARSSASLIGERIPDLQLYVLDDRLQPVPMGVPGELFVGGAGLARGYLHRPELTAWRFVPDPYSGNPASRLYRTGDLGRITPDGDIEYVGRADFQVKIRGFRIELGEIEAALQQHEAVSGAVVIVREDEPGDKRLVAYLTVNAGQGVPASNDLRRYLLTGLPDYMVPAAFVTLDQFPMTAHGKTDLRALPAPAGGQTRAGKYVAPRNKHEEILADIYAEVLGLDRVSITDGFFELGGDSIRGIRVLARAKQANLDLTIQDLFTHQTVKAVASATRQVVKPFPKPEAFSLLSDADRALAPADAADVYPASQLQKGMLFHCEFDPEGSVYHNLSGFHLRANFDAEVFRGVMRELLHRHDVLRTSFDLQRYSEPMQMVWNNVDIPLEIIDLTNLPEAERDERYNAWFESEINTHFDFTKAPLWRVTIHLTSPDTFHVTLTEHHAIVDGWSVALLMSELFEKYFHALDAGLTVPQVTPAVRFRDFVAHERAIMKNQDARRFWIDRLSDFSFNAVPRFGQPDGPASSLEVAVSEPISLKLKNLARQAGVPIKSVLLAAHLRVLGQITNSRDVLTGLVANGRTEQLDGDKVMGLFLNTMPYRLRIQNGTWMDLVRATFEVERDCLPHRDFPLAEIQHLHGENLFETAFNYTHFHVYEQVLAVNDLEVLSHKIHAPTNFPLAANFSMDVATARIQLSMEYDPDQFGGAQIARYAGYYVEALKSIATHPESHHDTHGLLPLEERRRLLEEWNDTARDYPKGQSVQSLFEAAAAANPSAPAVFYENQSLTYGELNRRANFLAYKLLAQGVGPETIVGVCVDRSLEMIVSALAVLKAGAAYVPIDPAYPEERITFMLEDTHAPVVLTQTVWASHLPEGDRVVIHVDAEEQTSAIGSFQNPTPNLKSANPAYLIYTSGSTGTPKGVMITHASAVNQLFWRQDRWKLEADDRVLLILSFSFDPSFWHIFWPLSFGAQLQLIPTGTHQNVVYLAQYILDRRITVTAMAPSMLRLFLEEEPFSRCKHLKHISVGGEMVPIELQERFIQTVAPDVLEVVYGPTEATIDASSWTCRPNAGDLSTATIGYPMSNVALYVLDQDLSPAPMGTPGQLFIAGAGLARGYFERPGLTAERFLPNPFSLTDDARMYATGDLVRHLPNGALEFLGRIDTQVKVRGFRIELGEVEAALNAHEDVAEAVVIVREDRPGDKRLTAYVRPKTTLNLTQNQWRSFLTESLPDYMVPSAFVYLNSFPTTPAGKVNRKVLPAPVEAAEEVILVDPTNETEHILVDIWKRTLGVENVGIRNNFFELGGDSILSIQITARAKHAGLVITPKQIFENQTIEELARVVQKGVALVGAEQGEVTGDVPLTPVMHWFFDLNSPAPQHFNQAVMLASDTRLDGEMLQTALDRLVQHHDALRLRRTANGLTHAQAEAPVFTEHDLAKLSTQAREAKISEIAAQMHTCLNLESGPLINVALFHGGNDGDRLLLVIHHLIIDGVSWRILLEDLQTAYTQLESGHAVQLQPKTTSFKAWSEQLENHATSTPITAQMEHWTAVLQDAAPLPVDRDGTADHNTVAAVNTLETVLDRETTRKLLQEAGSAYNTRINDLLLTALTRAFTDWTGEDSLLLDLESHGREELFEGVDTSRTVGWFTAVHPVRTHRGEDCVETLKRVKQDLSTIPDGGLGYGLLRYLNPQTAPVLTQLPQAQVAFNYLGQLDRTGADAGPLRLTDEPTGPAHAPAMRRAYLLDVNGAVSGGELRLTWAFSPNLHRRETVFRLAEKFNHVLRKLVDHCTTPGNFGYTPSDFPLAGLDQDALDRLIGQTQGVADVYPLSPMQQGMLFHTIYQPQSAVYLQQMSFTLAGTLDREALQEAWSRVAERNPIMRTSFAWDGLERPLQIVHRNSTIPWQFLDWREESDAGRQERYEAFLEQDRHQSFDLAAAPPLRFTLIHMTDTEVELVWSHHHILADGWSLPVMCAEAFAVYETLKGQPLPVPPQGRPYRDYIAWLESQDQDQARDYWSQTLADFDTPTPLPLDAGTKAVRESGGHQDLIKHFTPAETTAMQQFARHHRLTLNTLVQGAWALTLNRYSGEQDVLFGATVSGRPTSLPGVESMVGLFINTLPVRVAVNGRTDLHDWLTAIQAGNLTREGYAFTPLVDIQRLSGVTAGQNLFNSIVVFENYPLDEALKDKGETVKIKDVRGFEATEFPLTLAAVPGESLHLRVSYDTTRFTAETVSQFLSHFHQALAKMLDPETQTLADCNRLSDADRRLVLTEWNQTQKTYPTGVTLHQIITEQAARTPDAPALLLDGDQTPMTFAQLDRETNRLARYLRANGVVPETLVGVCLERSRQMVLALNAIHKAGGAYVPMDPEYPTERLRYMAEDSGAPIILTLNQSRDVVPQTGAKIIALDDEAVQNALAQLDTAPMASGVTAANAAYMIYTSGSTGRPKGVLNSHAGICNRIFWMQDAYQLTAQDTVLQKTPFSFDVSVWEFFWSQMTGAKLVMAKPGGHKDPHYLADLIDRHGVTTMHFVPGMLHAFVDTDFASKLPGLRQVFASGEALPTALAHRFGQRFSAALHNLYGPTEAAVDVTFRQSRAEDAGATIPIGRPIANTRIYVLDQDLQPVPPMVPGELFIAGVNLARGYHGRGDLTAEKFIADPYGAAGDRLYRSGDLVRFLPDGDIEFLGRIDHQVKLRGFRIELGEIEAALLAHANLSQALVMVTELNPGNQILAAWLVPAEGAEAPQAAELRTFLADFLPDFMIPTVFIPMDAFPLNPSGKVDRRALPAPDASRLSAEYTEPRTPVEVELAEIWSEILGRERLGVNDNFFESGGHSLLATRVISAVRDRMSVSLKIKDLFEAPTIEQFATLIEPLRNESHRTRLPAITPLETKDKVTLSFPQERLWFLEELEPGTAQFNMGVTSRLKGNLNIGFLEQALNLIVERHESLRTVFFTEAGTGFQRVTSYTSFSLPQSDLSHLDKEEALKAAANFIQSAFNQPFDLKNGPLTRFHLIKVDRDEHVLLITQHHIISDGWSLSIFNRELIETYRALSHGQAPQLPALPVQYADYAAWQRQWIEGRVLEEQAAYWKSRLSGASTLLTLPTDRPRPAIQTHAGAAVHFTIDRDTTRALHLLSRDQNASLFMTLQSLLLILLSRYSGQSDITLGTLVANRRYSEVESLIGFFLNTLALRNDLSGNPSFVSLLNQVKHNTIEAYDHQDIPFEHVLDLVEVERHLDHAPLFQVMMILQNTPETESGVEDLKFSPMDPEVTHAKFDITLEMVEQPDGLKCFFEYNVDLFDHQRMVRMVDHFQNIVSEALHRPGDRINNYALVTGSERQQIVEDWAGQDLPKDGHPLVQCRFEDWVQKTPDAEAVVFVDPDNGERHALTYAQMNVAANRIAHQLRASGIGPEMVVGVSFNRSIAMVVACVGVLKAGAAFLPMDPGYPQARLEYMVSHSGASAFITDTELAELLPLGDLETLFLDPLGNLIDSAFSDGAYDHNPEPVNLPDHMAYLIFTSGSTGKPKAVILPHRAWMNTLNGFVHNHRLDHTQRRLQLANLAFDVFAGDLGRTFIVGASMVVAARETMLDPIAVYKLIDAERITHFEMVPALLRPLLQYIEAEGKSLSHLRQIASGSDVMFMSEYRRFLKLLGDTELLNTYGITETAIDSTLLSGDLPDLADNRPVPIGRPLINQRVYILDDAMNPVAVGIPGELYIGGGSLARGYYGNVEQTVMRYVPDPFASEAGARLYRSGDRVAWLPNGNIGFMGRVDNQVKIRGVRIELGEIEAVLTKHPAVEQAVVLVHEKNGGQLVVAYVSGEAIEDLNDTLRNHVREHLVEQVVPTVCIHLPEIPLTPNGKLDRKALPTPDDNLLVREEDFVAPESETEIELARIWAEVLGLDQDHIGILDNFFDLGGHSLLVTQVLHRINNTFAVEISLKDLFEDPTIGNIALLIEEAYLDELDDEEGDSSDLDSE